MVSSQATEKTGNAACGLSPKWSVLKIIEQRAANNNELTRVDKRCKKNNGSFTLSPVWMVNFYMIYL